MDKFDAGAFLADMARPLPLADLVRNGDLIDQTLAAQWMGFTVRAYITGALYDAAVLGTSRKLRTATERSNEAGRLKMFWQTAAAAAAVFRKRGVAAPAIVFQVPAARSSLRLDVHLTFQQEGSLPYLVARLAKE